MRPLISFEDLIVEEWQSFAFLNLVQFLFWCFICLTVFLPQCQLIVYSTVTAFYFNFGNCMCNLTSFFMKMAQFPKLCILGPFFNTYSKSTELVSELSVESGCSYWVDIEGIFTRQYLYKRLAVELSLFVCCSASDSSMIWYRFVPW